MNILHINNITGLQMRKSILYGEIKIYNETFTIILNKLYLFAISEFLISSKYNYRIKIATQIICVRYFIVYHLRNINQSGENIVFHRSIIFTIRWHLTLCSLHTSKMKTLLFHLILLILECMLVNITVIHQLLISIFSIIT